MTPPSDNPSPRSWLLVPSFLFGPQTWVDVAASFEARGDRAIVAAPTRPLIDDENPVERWAGEVADALPIDRYQNVVIVGHSASCPRLPLVASMLVDRGADVTGVVLVNGRFPADGRSPIEEDVPLGPMLDGLIRPDGYLPPWQRWWGSLVEDMLPDEAARNRIFREAHCVPRALFDVPIPAPPLPRSIGLGYLTMGEMYRPSHDRAVSEGWVVGEVKGEHLHMVVDPRGVTDALEDLVGQFARPRT